jgi:hypothetical protein
MSSISYIAGGSLVSIEFDVLISETHTLASTVTDHPVEKGAPVTDHVRAKPREIAFQAFVTNFPIRVPGSNLDGTKGGVDTLTVEYPVKGKLPVGIPGVGAILAATGALDTTEKAKATTLQFDGPVDRIRSVFSELETLWQGSTPITIESSLGTYEDMQIVSLQAPREAKDGSSIVFAFSAKAVRYVETKTVKAPKTTAGKTNKGPKPAKDATPQRKKSMLRKVEKGELF